MAMPGRCVFYLCSDISNDPHARRDCARSGARRKRTAYGRDKQRDERALFNSG